MGVKNRTNNRIARPNEKDRQKSLFVEEYRINDIKMCGIKKTVPQYGEELLLLLRIMET